MCSTEVGVLRGPCHSACRASAILPSMHTLDERASRSGGFLNRLKRDVTLLVSISRMLVQYFTEGRRIRNAYRRHIQRGDVLWLDEQGPTQHRDAAMTGER